MEDHTTPTLYQHFTFVQENSHWYGCQCMSIDTVQYLKVSLVDGRQCQCCVLSHLWCRSSLIWWQVTQQLSGITWRAGRERGELEKNSCLSLLISKNKNINNINSSFRRGGAKYLNLSIYICMFYWEEATCNLHDHVIKPCVTWYCYHLPSSKSSMTLSKQLTLTHIVIFWCETDSVSIIIEIKNTIHKNGFISMFYMQQSIMLGVVCESKLRI